jgi:hypothetical protein
MTSADHPVLHALSAEPRTARAGEVVRVTFRTRNVGTQPSPAGTVAFALGEGLEALDDTEVHVEPVAPHEDVVAAVRARVAAAMTDRTEIVVRAALHLPDTVLGTNACTVIARSRAVLGGPASGTFVEAVDGDTVRVRAAVVNEGDGPACGVRVAVPAPIGCVRVAPGDVETREIARLDPGESAELAFEARIVAPVGELRADGGEVRFGEGRRVALPAREAVAPEPLVAEPHVVLIAGRRGTDIAIDLRNDGWADAHDVRLEIALPATLRAIAGSIAVDGVPVDDSGIGRKGGRGKRAVGAASAAVARAERKGDRTAIVISTIPARSSVHVTMAAWASAPGAEGTIGVEADAHHLDVPFAAERVRNVRVRVAGVPRTVSPGEIARVLVGLVNAGDVEETLSLEIAEDRAAPSAGVRPVQLPEADAATCAASIQRTLRPGATEVVEVPVRVRACAGDGEMLSNAAVVFDDGGERARAPFALLVRDRVWLALDEAPTRATADAREAGPGGESGGDVTQYTVRNDGSSPARDVAATFGDLHCALEPIPAGATAVVEVEAGAARHGGVVTVGGREVLALPGLPEDGPATVYAVLRGPQGVVAGAPFAVRLDVDVEDAVDVLAVRVFDAAGCSYVPGSTLLDGRVLLDRAGGASTGACAPLAGEGLRLRGVPGGTRITLTWSLLADSRADGVPLHVAAALDVDGEARGVAPLAIAVRARDVFAARPAGLAYHLEACTIAPQLADVDVDVVCATDVADVQAAGSRAAGVPAAGVRAADVHVAITESEPLAESLAPARRKSTVFALRLDADRAEEISRLLHGVRGGGLVAHLFAVRLFFPDTVVPDELDGAGLTSATSTSGERTAAGALDAVRGAVRDVFDRLYVKLRIPGFDVSSDDLDDPALRSALVTLVEALRDETLPGKTLPCRALVDSTPAGACAGFADAAYGAPAALRALVALLPARCDEDPLLAAAVSRYARLLDDVLCRYEGVPLELFDDALAHLSEIALDDARADVLAALGPHVAPVQIAC